MHRSSGPSKGEGERRKANAPAAPDRISGTDHCKLETLKGTDNVPEHSLMFLDYHFGSYY